LSIKLKNIDTHNRHERTLEMN